MLKRPRTALHQGSFVPKEPSFPGAIRAFPSGDRAVHNLPFPWNVSPRSLPGATHPLGSVTGQVAGAAKFAPCTWPELGVLVQPTDTHSNEETRQAPVSLTEFRTHFAPLIAEAILGRVTENLHPSQNSRAKRVSTTPCTLDAGARASVNGTNSCISPFRRV